MPNKNTIDNFWENVEIPAGYSPDSCWLWKSTKNDKGYGVFRLFGRADRAHRFSFEIAHRHLPECVCHKCDNRLCVNPLHLFAGTRGDNNRDRTKKGRSARGEKNGCAKLTSSDVVAIRKEYESGGITQRALAKKYGVSQYPIKEILLGRAWKME